MRVTAPAENSGEVGQTGQGQKDHEPSKQVRLVAREAGGTAIAGVVGAPMRYVMIFLSTRILGAGGYGAYTLAMTVCNIISVLSVMGLSPGVLPFLSRARHARDTQALKAIVRASVLMVAAVSFAGSALLWASSGWVSRGLFNKPHLQIFLQLLAPTIFFGAVGIVLMTLIQGFLAVKERAWTERFLMIAVSASGMAMAWFFGWGLWGVSLATVFGAASVVIAGAWYLHRKLPGAFGGGARGSGVARSVLAYSWPLMGTSMLSFLLLWTDLFVMGIFRKSAEVGIYGVCSKLAIGVLMVHESIIPIFTPRLSDLHASGRKDQIEDLYHLTARWALWPGLAIGAGIILWSSELLGIFGAEFKAGAQVLTILVVGKAVAVAMGMSGNFLAVTGKTRLHLANMVLLVGGNFLLNLAWTPRYGGVGAAASTTVSLVAVNCLRTAQIWHYHRMLPWNLNSLTPFLSAPLTAVLVFPFRHAVGGTWGWVVPALGYTVVYAILFFSFGVTAEDREVWKALKERTRRKNGRPSPVQP